MKTNTQQKKAVKDLGDVAYAVKGLFDEARVQVHLGAMQLKGDAGPYLAQVSAASKAAARDIAKRGKALRAELKRLRADHARARR